MLAAVLALGVQAAPLTDRPGAPGGIDAPPSTSPGSTLDRTLQVDTDAAQRDVELLLETRGSADGEPPPAAERATRAPTAAPAPAARPHSAGAADADAAGGAATPGLFRHAVHFLREHRFWLLAALALIALVAVGAQLWRRLRADAPERRLRELAGQQRSSRGRRRSSRH